jgi:hypothetical protein
VGGTIAGGAYSTERQERSVEAPRTTSRRWAAAAAALAWAAAIGAPGAVGAKSESCVFKPSLLNKATGMSFTALPHQVALGPGGYYCIYNSSTFSSQGGGLQLNIDVSTTTLADYTSKEKGWEAYGSATKGAAFEKVKALAADNGYLYRTAGPLGNSVGTALVDGVAVGVSTSAIALSEVARVLGVAVEHVTT